MKIRKVKEKPLLLQIKRQDQQAFIKAYDLYVDQIYRFIYFKVGNSEEARDLTSATFLKTWAYLQTGEEVNAKTLRSLFYKIARNLIIDHYRKISQRQLVSLNENNNIRDEDFTDEKQDIARQIATAFDLMIVETKLPELKEEYREVIIMRFVNELSIKEIADVLAKSRTSVRVLIYRALNALRELIKDDDNNFYGR